MSSWANGSSSGEPWAGQHAVPARPSPLPHLGSHQEAATIVDNHAPIVHMATIKNFAAQSKRGAGCVSATGGVQKGIRLSSSVMGFARGFRGAGVAVLSLSAGTVPVAVASNGAVTG